MKILFYLRLNVMGGAERYLFNLLPALKNKHIEVGFFCTRQNGNEAIIETFTRHFQQHLIPVYTCKAEQPYSLKAAQHLTRIVKSEGYTILSAHLLHAEIISVIAKLFFGLRCPLVTTKHGYLQKFMDQYGLNESKINKLSLSYLTEKYLQNFITGNFAVSKGMANFYTSSGLCKVSKMEVIYHGLAVNSQKLVEKKIPIRYSPNQLLVLARLKKFKGHRFLIEAVNLLRFDVPDLKLVIAGAGDELANLVDTVNKLNLNNWIIFEGYTDSAEQYIDGSDVVIVPSLAEPFGLSVLEAYSHKKPVIAFDVTALNENIINNQTGYLVTPYNVKALAEKIKYLLLDKELARQMGENGYMLLQQQFSKTVSVKKTIDFFQKHQDMLS